MLNDVGLDQQNVVIYSSNGGSDMSAHAERQLASCPIATCNTRSGESANEAIAYIAILHVVVIGIPSEASEDGRSTDATLRTGIFAWSHPSHHTGRTFGLGVYLKALESIAERIPSICLANDH